MGGQSPELREVSVPNCTDPAGFNYLSPAGPPLPPRDVHVQCGQAPGILQVHWKPPLLTPMGTSNGANVIGYAVCTKGQRVSARFTEHSSSAMLM